MAADAPKGWPSHVASLVSNTDEVDRLMTIHEVFTEGAPGKPPNLEVIHKSAVVLVIACWEAYVEDLAKNAYEALMNAASTPRVFPYRVLTLASKRLSQDPDGRKVWQLAGEGWRDVLAAHRNEILERFIGRLNTPRPRQVDELFEQLLGLKGLSANWKWKKMANPTCIKKLDDLITLRGEIAHRVSASRSVTKKDVTASVNLVNRLAAISSNVVRQFVLRRTGSEPWVNVVYGATG
jgi:hypothetical protein